MKRSLPWSLPLTLAALLATAGAGLAEDMAGMTMPTNATPADKAYERSMRVMMKDMDRKPTGRPDDDFVTMMLPHHQGAVDMAKIELRYGKDPVLRRLARSVVAAQNHEIAIMRAWRTKHAR